MPREEQIITLSDEALSRVLEIRSREPDAAELALRLEVSGRRGPLFGYELTFVPVGDTGDGDVLSRYGPLPVVIAADSIDRLRGAGLRLDDGGLALDNPNRPDPEPWWPGEEAPLHERVAAVLDHEINPAIAGHGGWAQLVQVEGATVYLNLGGGCQGCGMAQMTLRHGIETGLRRWVPEIGEVLDVTDHAAGDHPYF